MTVFRLDGRANEVEQLHVPNDAHSSLQPLLPHRQTRHIRKVITPFPITVSHVDTVLQTSFYGWVHELSLLQESQTGTLQDPLYGNQCLSSGFLLFKLLMQCGNACFYHPLGRLNFLLCIGAQRLEIPSYLVQPLTDRERFSTQGLNSVLGPPLVLDM